MDWSFWIDWAWKIAVLICLCMALPRLSKISRLAARIPTKMEQRKSGILK